MILLPPRILQKLHFYSSSSSSSSSIINLINETQTLQTLIKSGSAPSAQTLAPFLSFLLRSRKPHLLLRLFPHLSSEPIRSDPRTLTLVARALLESHRLDEAARFISRAEHRLGFASDIGLWDSLIRRVCVFDADPRKALTLLQECVRYRGIVPSVITFRVLVSSFCSQGDMESAVEVFDVMLVRKKGFPIDNHVCSLIISGFSKIGKPELGVGFYESLKKFDGFSPNLITYTAVVDALGRVGRVEEASDLVRKMEDEGVALDAVLYNSWICAYLREGFLMEGLRKHRLMVDKGIVPDVVNYTTIIDGLCEEGNVEKVIGFLKDMDKRNINPNLVTYTALIGGFCKRNKFEEAFYLVRKIEEMGIVIDEFVFSILINSLCRKGDLDRAVCLLEEMKTKGIKVGMVTYNALINGLGKAGKINEANEISQGLNGDNFTYSTLLHCHTKESDVDSVIGVKSRLENAGILMDVVTCNALIKAMFVVGKANDACNLFVEMPEMGLTANSITYCIMIDWYLKRGMIDKALELFNEYRNSSSCYDAVVHNYVISRLCNEGMVDKAGEVFEDLIAKDLILDSVIYRKLIRTHFKEGAEEGVLKFIYKTEELEIGLFFLICNDAISFLSTKDCSKAALDVYLLLRRKDFGVTSKACYVLLKSLLRNGNEHIAKVLLSECIKFHGIFEPRMVNLLSRYLCKKNVEEAIQFSNNMGNQKISISVIRATIDSLKKEGRLHDAYNFVMKTEENGMLLDEAVYSMVIDGLCKTGCVEKALDLCARMRGKGIDPNIVIHNSVLHGLCLQGCLIEAFRLFDSLEQNNMLPTLITYSTLIGALCREGLLHEANQLFKSMIIRGITTNTRVYNLIISGYGNFGLIKQALKLLVNLEENSLLPDAFTVSAIISGYCLKGDIEGALSFFDEYRRREILPDFLGFMNLVKGLYAKGRMEEARSILTEMFQCKDIVNLINSAGDDLNAEPLVSLLSLACKQGKIQEVIVILNEVRLLSISSSNSANHSRLTQLKNLQDIEAVDVPRRFFDCLSSQVTTADTIYVNYNSPEIDEHSNMEECNDLMGKSLHDDFDSYYPIIASLCSKGELKKANNVVKAMLLNSG
uniref:Pentatricopeptide repeat-containing protein At5g57250, mitochondrial n=1 Tax=Ananas comosus var. bracteatus TaxID=296719 RepID=A0A6V7QAE9_ANACO|nr:unnamed protein product [Ananas comosus var. bracteatus]